MPRVILTGVAEKDGNLFTATCPELEVASFGDTVEESLDMLEEALEVYLEELADLGYLDRKFQECGVAVLDDIPDKGEEVQASTLPGQVNRTYVMKIPVLAAG